MYKIFLFKITVIFIIFEVVSNQITINFEPPKVWFDKVGKKITPPAQFADIAEATFNFSLKVSVDKTQTRGMVSDVTKSVTGFIRSALCLPKCILNYMNDCPGGVSCAWKCVAPPEEKEPESSVVDNQNDDDIIIEKNTPDISGPKDLTPTDIVQFFICFMKCMTKYLPFNKTRLQQFTICLSIKCFCNRK